MIHSAHDQSRSIAMAPMGNRRLVRAHNSVLYLVLLAASVIMSGCGANPVTFNTYSVPTEYEPYVNAFRQELAARGIPHTPYLVLDATDYNPAQDAECIQDGMGDSPHIAVNPTFWASAGYNDRLEVIYHELGHCWLGIMHHDDDVLSNGWPASTMNTYHFDGDYWMANYTYYMNQEVSLAGF